jgi:hypothetical protein
MPRRSLRTILIALALALAGPVAGQTPAVIEAATAGNFAACSEAGGTPSTGPDYLTEVELNGDGTPDYVMNMMGLTCENAVSYFCGSAGCPVTVWLSGPGGHADAWSNYAQGIEIQGQTVVAYLHGQFCNPPTTGDDGCEERLDFAGMKASAAPAATTAPADAPAPAAVAPDPARWVLRQPEGSPAVAIVGGPGELRSMAAFCLEGHPWLALLFNESPAADTLALQFDFASHGPIGGPAQREPTSGGAYMVTLNGSPLASWMAGRDGSATLAVDGRSIGTVSLAGSSKALRGALAPCLTF